MSRLAQLLQREVLATWRFSPSKDELSCDVGGPYHFIADDRFIDEQMTKVDAIAEVWLTFRENTLVFVDAERQEVNPDVIGETFICPIWDKANWYYYRIDELPKEFANKKTSITHFIMGYGEGKLVDGYGRSLVEVDEDAVERLGPSHTRTRNLSLLYLQRVTCSLIAAYVIATIAAIGFEQVTTAYVFATVVALVMLFIDDRAMQSMPRLFGTTLLAVSIGVLSASVAIALVSASILSPLHFVGITVVLVTALGVLLREVVSS